MGVNPDHPKIFAQMAAAMAEITAIAKDKKNEQQGFKYRGIDDVYNAVNPILARNGIFMTSRVIDKARDERVNSKGTVLAFTCLRLEYTFWADDGSSVSTEVEGEGMDSGDKSSNKAMAVAHKYALLQAFCIPTQDLDDPDSEVHEVRPGDSRTSQPKKAAPETKDEPPHVKAAKGIIAKARTISDPDEFMAYADGVMPQISDIETASKATADHVRKTLGELEAALKVAA